MQSESTCFRCWRMCRTSKLLPCDHLVCQTCLDMQSGDREAPSQPPTVTCPICKQVFLVPSGPEGVPTSCSGDTAADKNPPRDQDLEAETDKNPSKEEDLEEERKNRTRIILEARERIIELMKKTSAEQARAINLMMQAQSEGEEKKAEVDEYIDTLREALDSQHADMIDDVVECTEQALDTCRTEQRRLQCQMCTLHQAARTVGALACREDVLLSMKSFESEISQLTSSLEKCVSRDTDPLASVETAVGLKLPHEDLAEDIFGSVELHFCEDDLSDSSEEEEEDSSEKADTPTTTSRPGTPVSVSLVCPRVSCLTPPCLKYRVPWDNPPCTEPSTHPSSTNMLLSLPNQVGVPPIHVQCSWRQTGVCQPYRTPRGIVCKAVPYPPSSPGSQVEEGSRASSVSGYPQYSGRTTPDYSQGYQQGQGRGQPYRGRSLERSQRDQGDSRRRSSSRGADGQSGPSGAYGQSGPSGAYGQSGPRGAYGQNGPRGAYGQSGPSGAYGQSGPSGAYGQSGPSGAYGQSGPSGAYGQKGPRGAYGQSGPSGAYGQNGPSGAYGQNGPSGAYGQNGPSGAYGQKGPRGAYGQKGPRGAYGQKGPRGAYGKRSPRGGKGKNSPRGGKGQKRKLSAGEKSPTRSQQGRSDGYVSDVSATRGYDSKSSSPLGQSRQPQDGVDSKNSVQRELGQTRSDEYESGQSSGQLYSGGEEYDESGQRREYRKGLDRDGSGQSILRGQNRARFEEVDSEQNSGGQEREGSDQSKKRRCSKAVKKDRTVYEKKDRTVYEKKVISVTSSTQTEDTYFSNSSKETLSTETADAESEVESYLLAKIEHPPRGCVCLADGDKNLFVSLMSAEPPLYSGGYSELVTEHGVTSLQRTVSVPIDIVLSRKPPAVEIPASFAADFTIDGAQIHLSCSGATLSDLIKDAQDLGSQSPPIAQHTSVQFEVEENKFRTFTLDDSDDTSEEEECICPQDGTGVEGENPCCSTPCAPFSRRNCRNAHRKKITIPLTLNVTHDPPHLHGDLHGDHRKKSRESSVLKSTDIYFLGRKATSEEVEVKEEIVCNDKTHIGMYEGLEGFRYQGFDELPYDPKLFRPPSMRDFDSQAESEDFSDYEKTSYRTVDTQSSFEEDKVSLRDADVQAIDDEINPKPPKPPVRRRGSHETDMAFLRYIEHNEDLSCRRCLEKAQKAERPRPAWDTDEKASLKGKCEHRLQFGMDLQNVGTLQVKGVQDLALAKLEGPETEGHVCTFSAGEKPRTIKVKRNAEGTPNTVCFVHGEYHTKIIRERLCEASCTIPAEMMAYATSDGFVITTRHLALRDSKPKHDDQQADTPPPSPPHPAVKDKTSKKPDKEKPPPSSPPSPTRPPPSPKRPPPSPTRPPPPPPAPPKEAETKPIPKTRDRAISIQKEEQFQPRKRVDIVEVSSQTDSITEPTTTKQDIATSPLRLNPLSPKKNVPSTLPRLRKPDGGFGVNHKLPKIKDFKRNCYSCSWRDRKETIAAKTAKPSDSMRSRQHATSPPAKASTSPKARKTTEKNNNTDVAESNSSMLDPRESRWKSHKGKSSKNANSSHKELTSEEAYIQTSISGRKYPGKFVLNELTEFMTLRKQTTSLYSHGGDILSARVKTTKTSSVLKKNLSKERPVKSQDESPIRRSSPRKGSDDSHRESREYRNVTQNNITSSQLRRAKPCDKALARCVGWTREKIPANSLNQSHSDFGMPSMAVCETVSSQGSSGHPDSLRRASSRTISAYSPRKRNSLNPSLPLPQSVPCGKVPTTHLGKNSFRSRQRKKSQVKCNLGNGHDSTSSHSEDAAEALHGPSVVRLHKPDACHKSSDSLRIRRLRMKSTEPSVTTIEKFLPLSRPPEARLRSRSLPVGAAMPKQRMIPPSVAWGLSSADAKDCFLPRPRPSLSDPFCCGQISRCTCTTSPSPDEICPWMLSASSRRLSKKSQGSSNHITEELDQVVSPPTGSLTLRERSSTASWGK